VKFLIDVPDPSPLAPRLSYPESVVHEIGTAVHEAGGRLMTHVMGEHVALALEGGADSIEHGTFASPDELREMAARRVAWTPTLSTIAGRYLEPMGISAPLDLLRTTLPLAADVGVPILAGTDEEPPGTVAAEVAKLIEYGVPPEVAIAAATTTARAFLGLPSLEDGAPADLVTFEDATLARPTGVLSGGERIT
jgi:imidazolonepropionase-like amidohydrolase